MKRTLLFGCASLLTLSAIAYAQVPGVNSTLNAVFNLVYDNATEKATYSAAFQVTAATNPTDIVEFVGSATKKIKIRRIRINGTATAAGILEVLIVRRNAVDTAGTATFPVISQYDTSSPTGQGAATAVVETYAANPTEPAAMTILVETLVAVVPTGTLAALHFPPLDYLWGAGGNTPVLRGTAQTLVINLNGKVNAGTLLYITIEWTEE